MLVQLLSRHPDVSVPLGQLARILDQIDPVELRDQVTPLRLVDGRDLAVGGDLRALEEQLRLLLALEPRRAVNPRRVRFFEMQVGEERTFRLVPAQEVECRVDDAVAAEEFPGGVATNPAMS